MPLVLVFLALYVVHTINFTNVFNVCFDLYS